MSGVALIQIVHCDGRAENLSFGPGTHSIGRAASDLTIAGDRNVSRRHATLEVLANAVRITDLGSTFGTFDTNGNKITGAYTLKPGVWVLLGRTKLKLLNAVGGAGSGRSGNTAMTQPDWDPGIDPKELESDESEPDG
ncbi:MAG TPA: FHA domain-containing protein [Polyangiaceae bacterium]|jgi:pSer/pThr/pTyr-binding forkhead associated (FHA) protein|nr:FHA domain-containing protein [Polyangiaceae bacterium]